ncbi:hypothetical protein Emed_004277 [Eimeria media]
MDGLFKLKSFVPSTVGAVLAVVAVVFLISYCRVWVRNSVGSSLGKRRLASGGEGGEEDAKKQKYQQICGTLKEGINPEDPEEETSTGGPSLQPPTIDVSDGGSLSEDERPRKRKSDHELYKEHGVSAKAAKLSDSKAVQGGTSGTSVTGKPTSSSLSSAGVKGGKMEAMQKLDSSQQLDLKQGSSEGSTLPSNRSEGEPSDLGNEIAEFTLEEALMAEHFLSLGSSSLNLEELPQPSSPLLPDDLIPELVEELGAYITEALEAKDDSLLQEWMLEPDAPMPPSPPSEAPQGEDKEESSQGSAVTQEGHEGEAQTSPSSLPVDGPEYDHHPFYHLPDVPASVLQELRIKYSYRTHLARYDFYGQLNAARRLLAKPSLDLVEAEELLGCANSLRAHASSRLRNALSGVSSFHFAHALALRFLIADTLWCACAVLGDIVKEGDWWQPLMELMLAIDETWSLEKFKRQRDADEKIKLVKTIMRVMAIYKAGQRPSAKDVVQIKQMIFCGEDVLVAFQQSLWNPWRQADRSFREALGRK